MLTAVHLISSVWGWGAGGGGGRAGGRGDMDGGVNYRQVTMS